MTQLSITEQATELLLELQNQDELFDNLIIDLEKSPNSEKITGAFEYSLKKSSNIIQKLTKLIKNSQQQNIYNISINKENDKNNIISNEFIKNFKLICINIEKKWKICVDIINLNNSNDSINSWIVNKKSKNYIDNHNNNNNNNDIENKVDSNDKSSDSMVQDVKFVEYKENKKEKLQNSIINLNHELQAVLDLTKDLNYLINLQQKKLNELDNNVEQTNEIVSNAADTIFSIKKSKITYGMIGGVSAMILGGGPALLLASSIKLAVGSTLGLGVFGIWSGTKYADVSNTKQDEQYNEMKQEINNNNDNNNNNNNNKNELNEKLIKNGVELKKRNVNNENIINNIVLDSEPLPDWDPKN